MIDFFPKVIVFQVKKGLFWKEQEGFWKENRLFWKEKTNFWKEKNRLWKASPFISIETIEKAPFHGNKRYFIPPSSILPSLLPPVTSIKLPQASID